MQVHIDLANARLARSDAIDSTVSGHARHHQQRQGRPSGRRRT
ncbi:MAG: hypothetical protein WDN06_04665 [Asticcacaulis sp.]